MQTYSIFLNRKERKCVYYYLLNISQWNSTAHNVLFYGASFALVNQQFMETFIILIMYISCDSHSLCVNCTNQQIQINISHAMEDMAFCVGLNIRIVNFQRIYRFWRIFHSLFLELIRLFNPFMENSPNSISMI